MARKPTGKPVGRPTVEFDVKAFNDLIALGCSKMKYAGGSETKKASPLILIHFQGGVNAHSGRIIKNIPGKIMECT